MILKFTSFTAHFIPYSVVSQHLCNHNRCFAMMASHNQCWPLGHSHHCLDMVHLVRGVHAVITLSSLDYCSYLCWVQFPSNSFLLLPENLQLTPRVRKYQCCYWCLEENLANNSGETF